MRERHRERKIVGEREYKGRERMNKERENGKWMGLKHVGSKENEGGREIMRENREENEKQRRGKMREEGLLLWRDGNEGGFCDLKGKGG